MGDRLLNRKSQVKGGHFQIHPTTLVNQYFYICRIFMLVKRPELYWWYDLSSARTHSLASSLRLCYIFCKARGSNNEVAKFAAEFSGINRIYCFVIYNNA